MPIWVLSPCSPHRHLLVNSRPSFAFQRIIAVRTVARQLQDLFQHPLLALIHLVRLSLGYNSMNYSCWLCEAARVGPVNGCMLSMLGSIQGLWTNIKGLTLTRAGEHY